MSPFKPTANRSGSSNLFALTFTLLMSGLLFSGQAFAAPHQYHRFVLDSVGAGGKQTGNSSVNEIQLKVDGVWLANSNSNIGLMNSPGLVRFGPLSGGTSYNATVTLVFNACCGRDLSMLFDGNDAVAWVNLGTWSGDPDGDSLTLNSVMAIFDFGDSPVEIEGMRIFGDPYSSGTEAPDRFRIEYSDDGSNYTTAYETDSDVLTWGVNGFDALITPTAPPPAAPTLLSAVAGDGIAVISFTAGSDGGVSITNYQYSVDGGSTYTALSPTVAISPVTIAPLTNGVTYSILLKAVNSSGTGTASEAVLVTPAAPPPAPSAPAPTAEEIAEEEEREETEAAQNGIIDEVSKIDLTSLGDDPDSKDLVNDIAARTANLLGGISSSAKKSLYSNSEKKEAIDLALNVLNIKTINTPPLTPNITDLSGGNTITLPTREVLKNIDSTMELITNISKVLVELPANDSSVKEIGENLISNVIDIISPLVITAVNLDDETAGKNADAAVDKFLDIQETITTNVSFNSGQLYIPSSFKNPNSVLNLVTKKKNLNIVNMKQRRKRANYLDVVNLLLAEPASDANANSLRTVSALEDGSTPTVGLSTANRFNGVAGFSGVDHNEVHSDFYFGNKVIPANIVSVSYSETTVDRPFVFNEDGSLKYKMDANTTATLYPAFYDVFELLQAIRSDFSSNVSVSENNVIKIRKDGASYYAKATFSPFELSESALANADAQFFIIDEVYTVIYGDGTEESLVPHFDPKLFDYLAAQNHSYQYKKKTGAMVIDGRSYMPDYLVEPLESFQDQLYLGINGDGRFDMALEQTYVNQDNILDLVVYTKAGKQAFIAQ